jgi:acid-sensing ion channel, other
VKIAEILKDETSLSFKNCDCLADCNSVEYDVMITEERIFIENKSLSVSGVKFQFSEDEFIAYRRYEMFGAVTFLSNIGGLLGLFLGISVLSVVEFFYFFFVRFINNLWHNENN